MMGSFRAVSYNFTATERAALSEGNNLFSSSIVFCHLSKKQLRMSALSLEAYQNWSHHEQYLS